MFLRIFLLTALLCSTCVSHAQISLRAFNYRPTGEFGAVMKPAFSAEIGYSKVFDDSPWRTNAALTFIKMTPRMEVFPTYVVQSGGNGTWILPGKQSFSKYNLIMFRLGFDYAFYYDERFAVYGGFDLVTGSASVAYTNHVQTFISEDYSGGGIVAGFRFRVGGDYYFNDTWSAMLTINREGFLVTEPAALAAANDYGIGIRYSFL